MISFLKLWLTIFFIFTISVLTAEEVSIFDKPEKPDEWRAWFIPSGEKAPLKYSIKTVEGSPVRTFEVDFRNAASNTTHVYIVPLNAPKIENFGVLRSIKTYLSTNNKQLRIYLEMSLNKTQAIMYNLSGNQFNFSPELNKVEIKNPDYNSEVRLREMERKLIIPENIPVVEFTGFLIETALSEQFIFSLGVVNISFDIARYLY
jgi:hypothetical protein